jgi:hypothetical protein
MKITIDISDFYLDEEQDLEPALKKTIIHQAVTKITADLKAKIEDGVNKEVKAQVEQTLYRKIGTFVAECIANDKIKDGYHNSPEITLQEWVKKQFTRNSYDKAPVDELIKKLAANFGDEMKKRYDLLFASQLVVKMKESGFIKEEAIALLLENKTS